MTGPDHFREAERMLVLANSVVGDDGDFGGLLAAAQVHATLALARAYLRRTS